MPDEATVGSVFNWDEPVSEFATDIGAGSGGGGDDTSLNAQAAEGQETALLELKDSNDNRLLYFEQNGGNGADGCCLVITYF